jgi:hypothetical protein
VATDTLTIDWTGKSGKSYKYWIHKIGTTFQAVAGNYVFSKETKPGYWAAIYIGETSDLSSRFDDHHQQKCIDKNGATHVHVHSNSAGADARRAEECDIIARWNPTCNEQ